MEYFEEAGLNYAKERKGKILIYWDVDKTVGGCGSEGLVLDVEVMKEIARIIKRHPECLSSLQSTLRCVKNTNEQLHNEFKEYGVRLAEDAYAVRHADHDIDKKLDKRDDILYTAKKRVEMYREKNKTSNVEYYISGLIIVDDKKVSPIEGVSTHILPVGGLLDPEDLEDAIEAINHIDNDLSDTILNAEFQGAIEKVYDISEDLFGEKNHYENSEVLTRNVRGSMQEKAII